MYINPVVRNHVLTVHDQADDQEVAVAKLFCRVADLRRLRIECTHQITDRHRADEISTTKFLASIRSVCQNTGDLARVVADSNYISLHPYGISLIVQLCCQSFPHLPGAALRIPKFVHKRLDISILTG